MAKEQERKFILNYLPENIGEPVKIKQAYLMLEEKDKTQLRVRIIEKNIYNLEAYICYKKCLSSTTKDEYEYEINLNDAFELFNSSKYQLTKDRYSFMYKGNNVDIDIYPNGLAVVEIEFEEDFEEIPDFCGIEVTGQREYSNIYLATGN